MSSYQSRSIEGATPLELVVALYDGMIRFLNHAMGAVERGDVHARRLAVKRVLDILLHLQATLRMDIGGAPAKALADFYATMFALILEASSAASREKFEHVIACIWNVRDAWKQVAADPDANAMLARHLREQAAQMKAVSRPSIPQDDNEQPVGWLA
jgi:flagellar protein FliS